ncbi:hypothetical protein H6P81_008617 [Aristolochia fimbriata]|uniref:Uncharacterized protein n=1 Tax=Aristolochia fimbriata TaxID=158543 RepID=A0AAV7ELT0_ARIFI|nr:hypothetical protein H6P81_008617 [Aristolochia fimbriata]
MRPVKVSSAAGFRNRNSPMPYLFVGVIAMLGLIGAALIILVCSFRKHRDSMTSESVKKPPEPVITPLEREPKVVVIMAGDDQPTFLAEPISRASSLQQQARALPSSSSSSSSS